MQGNYQEMSAQQQQHLVRLANAAGAQGSASYPGMVAYASSPMGGQGQYYSLVSAPNVNAAGAAQGGLPPHLFSHAYPTLSQHYSISSPGGAGGVPGQQHAYMMYSMPGISQQAVSAPAGGSGGGGGGASAGVTNSGGGGTTTAGGNSALGYSAVGGSHSLQGAILQQQPFPGYAVVSAQNVNSGVLANSSSGSNNNNNNNNTGKNSSSPSPGVYPQTVLGGSGPTGLEAFTHPSLFAVVQQRAPRQHQAQFLAHHQHHQHQQQQLQQQQQQQQQINHGIQFVANKVLHGAPTMQALPRLQHAVGETPPPPPPKLHDVMLEIRGEYGLDMIFNGLNTNTQAWPISTQPFEGGPSSSAEVAKKSLSTATLSGPLSPEAISSLLTYGLDPESVGLSLNETDFMYPSLSGLPYTDAERRLFTETHIPESYKKVKPRLITFKLYRSFSEMTLFYIFYSMPGDLLHVVAAQCLYERKWKYDMRHQIWYKEVKRSEAASSSASSSSMQGGAVNASGGAFSSHSDFSEMQPQYDVFETRSWSIKRCTDKVFNPADAESYEVLRERISRAGASIKNRHSAPTSSASSQGTASTSAASPANKRTVPASSSTGSSSVPRGSSTVAAAFASEGG